MDIEESVLISAVMMSAERVYSEIQKLDPEERLKLDRMLEAANDDPDPAVEEAWMQETLRRRAEWKAGNVKALPVEEALEQMFAKR